MKKIFAVISILLLMFTFIGCGDVDNSSTTPPAGNQTYDRTGTVQGKVMNALTGAAIGNDSTGDLQMWLIQGTDNKTPNKLITDSTSALVGEYAFTGIPVDINATEITFKIVAVKKGFQRFEADVTLNAAFDAGNNTLNAVYNEIGNIYLYPEGSSAGDVKVHVTAYSVPVSGALVYLSQNVVNNALSFTVADRLVPTAGLITSLSATTDASGVATFTGSKLVPGGSYTATAAAMTFNGAQYAENSTAAFLTDTAASNQYIAITAPTTGALFATSASNQVPGTADSTGKLTITFNQPVVLTTTWFAAVSTAGTITPVPSQQAIGVLSTDGLTLTITPVFMTNPPATAYGATVTYTYFQANQIRLKSTQASGGAALNNITNLATGAVLSGTVTLYNY